MWKPFPDPGAVLYFCWNIINTSKLNIFKKQSFARDSAVWVGFSWMVLLLVLLVVTNVDLSNLQTGTWDPLGRWDNIAFLSSMQSQYLFSPWGPSGGGRYTPYMSVKNSQECNLGLGQIIVKVKHKFTGRELWQKHKYWNLWIIGVH